MKAFVITLIVVAILAAFTLASLTIWQDELKNHLANSAFEEVLDEAVDATPLKINFGP